MDLVSSCKELKDILTQLGLSKQGKKQDLIDKISAILVDERVNMKRFEDLNVSSNPIFKMTMFLFPLPHRLLLYFYPALPCSPFFDPENMASIGGENISFWCNTLIKPSTVLFCFLLMGVKTDTVRFRSQYPGNLHVPGVSDLASKSQAISDSSTVKLEEEIVDSYQVKKVHCLCGSSLQTDSMIKCEDSKCSVWQHINCVIIPEKPMEAVRPVRPDSFYCELCRLSRADP
ncbi:hypothetical protein Leryth_021799 [Lithospermum erythrorhizon]|nr:hypothetical protein Leryth_021799 [Lithospermum erythrorhizon]